MKKIKFFFAFLFIIGFSLPSTNAKYDLPVPLWLLYHAEEQEDGTYIVVCENPGLECRVILF